MQCCITYRLSYIFISWLRDSEGTFWSLSQAASCASVYCTGVLSSKILIHYISWSWHWQHKSENLGTILYFFASLIRNMKKWRDKKNGGKKKKALKRTNRNLTPAQDFFQYNWEDDDVKNSCDTLNSEKEKLRLKTETCGGKGKLTSDWEKALDADT